MKNEILGNFGPNHSPKDAMSVVSPGGKGTEERNGEIGEIEFWRGKYKVGREKSWTMGNLRNQIRTLYRVRLLWKWQR